MALRSLLRGHTATLETTRARWDCNVIRKENNSQQIPIYEGTCLNIKVTTATAVTRRHTGAMLLCPFVRCSLVRFRGQQFHYV
jgi:hypothetical protein